MKISIMKVLSLLFFLTFHQTVRQTVHPMLAPDCYLNENISETVRFEIFEVVNITINRYCESATFWDEDLGQFDNEKYLEFIKLFSGSAEVLDDLSFNQEMLPYADYAQKIFHNLHEIGVPFDLEEIVIERIDIDEGGYYEVDLSVNKRLFSGINQNGHPVKLKRGRSIKLDIRMDLPDYLLEDARIQYVKLKAPKKIKDYMMQPMNYISRKLKRN